MNQFTTFFFPGLQKFYARVPAAIEEWETEAWRETYSRLDEIAENFKVLFHKIDGMITGKEREKDYIFHLIRRTLAQDIGLKMDITGLRSDAPQSGLFEHYYVHSAVSTNIDEKGKKIIEKENDCFIQFSGQGQLNIITGAPGSGKTTWATWVQREALNQRIDLFPVRINLRNYVSKDLKSLQDIIRETGGNHF